MITVGVDLGAKAVKVVVLRDGDVVARALTPSGFDCAQAAAVALDVALKTAQVRRDDVSRILATGTGAGVAVLADATLTEDEAAARGARHLFPDARTVIDVGAEEGRAIRLGDDGAVESSELNERCAAGAGAFAESMSRLLGISLEEMGALSLQSTTAISISAQCVVFAESEMISLVHARTPKEDLARAVHDAIAGRIVTMANRVGVRADVVLVGGLTRNEGFVASLARGLGTEVRLAGDPEYVGALGAALRAWEGQ